MNRILEGTVVLDLTRFLAGPQCTLMLAGLGAEVIKVDDPRAGDPTAAAPPVATADGFSFAPPAPGDYGLAYLKRARGKKSVSISLKHPEGLALFRRLVAQADVLVENFRAGVTERLGIDHATLSSLNQRLVYCSITGYGSTGSERGAKAYDLMVQAAAGLLAVTGEPGGGPVKAGTPLSDTIAGSMAALGVVSALHQRERTGRGQFVDVSMADCLLSLMWDEPLDGYEALGLAPRQGNRIMRFSPFNTYRTADGWIALGAATDAEWRALLALMGRAELAEHPDFSRVGWRIAHNDAVDRLVGEWTATRTTRALLDALAAADVSCGPVRDTGEVLAWERARERDVLVPVRRPDGSRTAALGPAFPLKFSDAATEYGLPPVPGGDTEALLSGRLGMSADEIARLRAAGAV